MALAAAITVNDRETTPVAHTFNPRGSGGGAGFYQFTEANSVPIGESNLTFRWRKSNNKHYVRMLMTVPILVTETINGVGVPTVSRVTLIDTTFRFDGSSTLQERKNAVGMFANALAASQTVVDSAVTKLEGIWG